MAKAKDPKPAAAKDAEAPKEQVATPAPKEVVTQESTSDFQRHPKFAKFLPAGEN